MAVYVALGSNRGPRFRHVERSLRHLADSYDIVQQSSWYLTEPVDVAGGWFLNGVVGIVTQDAPSRVLANLLAIERKLGRTRDTTSPSRESRAIDLDLLLYDQRVIGEPGLVVPHPRLVERAFVLVPLAEIAPAVIHPVLQLSMRQLCDQVSDAHRVERVEHTP